MNSDQFRAMLDLGRDGDGRTILPVAHGGGSAIFGGQMLAQLVAAVEPERTVKSLHVGFPREGRPHDPLYLDLENTHDGRTLGVRRAVVYQDTNLSGSAASLLPARSSLTAPTTGTTINSTPSPARIP